MATVFMKRNTVDLQFDLDEALSLPEIPNSTHWNNNVIATPNPTVDLQFDLDEALSLPEISNSAHWNNNVIATPNSNSLIIVNMPRAPATTTTAAAVHGDVCAVCMEALQAGDDHDQNGKQVPCGHVYHTACIDSWLFVCNSCPLCRSTILLKQ